MKVKIFNNLILVDLLTILLIIAIAFIPSNIIRIILGSPFILFFPGFTLTAALFPWGEEWGRLERIAISLGLSIAVSALIGIGLNYTFPGITLESTLYSISAFIIILSIIALIRRSRSLYKFELTQEITLGLPGWNGSAFNKSLALILAVCIISTIGVLGYALAAPKEGEKFSEFYILGSDGQAQDYPTEFTMTPQGLVTGVSYGSAANITSSTAGTVTLGIINHEYRNVSYTVVVKIDGQQVDIVTNGQNVSQLGPLELQPGQKLEQEIRFSPQHPGDNQKVEFLLYKDGVLSTENSLHLWIDVKSA